MKRITFEMLRAYNACEDQVLLFQKTFPEGAPVSMDSFAKASKAGLSVWFADQLLSGSAQAEYEKATTLALAQYWKTTDSAQAWYEKPIALAWAKYEKARASALVAALAKEKKPCTFTTNGAR